MHKNTFYGFLCPFPALLICLSCSVFPSFSPVLFPDIPFYSFSLNSLQFLSPSFSPIPFSPQLLSLFSLQFLSLPSLYYPFPLIPAHFPSNPFSYCFPSFYSIPLSCSRLPSSFPSLEFLFRSFSPICFLSSPALISQANLRLKRKSERE
jgi:hypothetical protein